MSVTARIPKSHKILALGLFDKLTGQKSWHCDGSLFFEMNEHNLGLMKGFEQIIIASPDFLATGENSAFCALTPKRRPQFCPPDHYFLNDGTIKKIDKLAHQEFVFNKFKDHFFEGCIMGALFAEMGTGKTKTMIDLINYNYCQGRIKAALVVAKNGVHHQWVKGESIDGVEVAPSPIAAFTQKDIKFIADNWSGRKLKKELFYQDDRLKWLTVNFEALQSKKVQALLDEFIEMNSGQIAFVGDETHKIKNPAARRTKLAVYYAKKCTAMRFIMTGTPLAKNLVDEWSQLNILSQKILGHKFMITFRNEYCVMGGFENRSVVGSKNIDRFKRVTAPFVYRIKKIDCTDLPPKQYRSIRFDLSKKQLDAINTIKKTQMLSLSNGSDLFFDGAAVALQKVQEISNGYLTLDGVLNEKYENPRMEVLLELLDGIEEKVIIWARYKRDVYDIIMNLPPNSAVSYYGEDSQKQRTRNKEQFCDPDSAVTYFVATPAAAAEGLDGLQKVCSTAIYYSNSFNSVERWQSEDRIHRIGMNGTALLIDLIANKSIDEAVVKNLKAKEELATLVLDVGREFGVNSLRRVL